MYEQAQQELQQELRQELPPDERPRELQKAIQKRYETAVNSLTDELKKDINVIAVILCGSLSYDKVWEKSDVDIIIVVRDQKLNAHSYCLDQDGIIMNVDIMTRSDFVKMSNKAIGGLTEHSTVSRGRILYTSDDSLQNYLDEMQTIGKNDMEFAALVIAADMIYCMQKTEKWLRVMDDVTYSRYYLLKLAGSIASFEVCINMESPSREAILRANELNPDLIRRFYFEPMNNPLTKDEIFAILKEADEYLVKHIDIFKKPVIEYLSDGEPKTMTMLTRYFHAGGHFMIKIIDFLCEKGVIYRVSQQIRVTPKGRQVAEEIAYIYSPEQQ